MAVGVSAGLTDGLRVKDRPITETTRLEELNVTNNEKEESNERKKEKKCKPELKNIEKKKRRNILTNRRYPADVVFGLAFSATPYKTKVCSK